MSSACSLCSGRQLASRGGGVARQRQKKPHTVMKEKQQYAFDTKLRRSTAYLSSLFDYQHGHWVGQKGPTTHNTPGTPSGAQQMKLPVFS